MEPELKRKSEELARMRAEMGELEKKERAACVLCEQLQGTVQTLTQENKSLHSKHLAEVGQCDGGVACLGGL